VANNQNQVLKVFCFFFSKKKILKNLLFVNKKKQKNFDRFGSASHL